MTVLGPNKGANIGSAVSFIGDFNGDGMDDIVIGADGMYNQLGGAYVLFGAPDINEIDLAHLQGDRGFHLKNIVPQHDETRKFDDDDRLAGVIVTGLGDINGDGLKDIAVASANCIFVIYGTRQQLAMPIDLSNLHRDTNIDVGFAIRSPGARVVHVGDVNGDGLNDIFVASAMSDFIASIIYGKSEQFHDDIDFTLENKKEVDGNLIYTIITKPHSSSFQHQIAGIGDINGDGLHDFAVASSDLSCTFILYGAKQMAPVINLNFVQVSRGNHGEFKAAIEHSHGFAVYGGLGPSPNFGTVINGGGDVNGDGLDDVIIGCSSCEYHENQGLAVLIYGSSLDDRDSLFFDLREGEDTPLSFRILQTTMTKEIAFVGDINHDGMDDIALVGKEKYHFGKSNNSSGSLSQKLSNGYHEGEPIILFGQREFPFYISSNEILHGNLPGLVIAGDMHHDYSGGTLDRFGHGGDFNGDGYADILVGLTTFTPYDNNLRIEAGVVQIVYGFETNLDTQRIPSSSSRILVMISPLLLMVGYVMVMACKHFRVNEFMMSHYKGGTRSKPKYQPVSTNEEDEDIEEFSVHHRDTSSELDENFPSNEVEMISVHNALPNRSFHSNHLITSMIVDREED